MARKTFFLFIVTAMIVASISLAPRATFAQTNSIEGDAKGLDGQPLVGAEIQLDRKDIKQHFQTKTDKNGHFFHAGLPTGTYRVSLWQDGKEITFHENIAIRGGEPIKHDFNLKADQEAAIKSMTKEQKEQVEKIEKEKKIQGDMVKSYNEGNTLFANKQYDQALVQFKSAAEIDPNQYAIFGRIAETYDRLKQSDDAVANYQKAIALLETQLSQKNDPKLKQDLASYYNNYGGALANAKKSKEAMDAYNKAVSINPESAGMVYYNMGAVLTNTHAPLEDRISAFKKATEADPKNANAWYQYGVTLSEKMSINKDGTISAPPEMIAALNKYLELDPNGRYAEGAKGLIQAAGQTVQTSFGSTKDASKKTKK